MAYSIINFTISGIPRWLALFAFPKLPLRLILGNDIHPPAYPFPFQPAGFFPYNTCYFFSELTSSSFNPEDLSFAVPGLVT